MNKKISAKTVYYIFTAAAGLFFQVIFTLSGLYRINTVKLDPLQLVLVGTVLEAAVFIFEIPTGIVADLKSRKLSVIIGILLIGAGFILEGSCPVFLAVLIAQIVWGIGYTFTSGAEEAWLADEVGEESLEHVYLRAAQISQLFSLIGIPLSVLLATIALNIPLVIGGIMFIVLAVFLIIFMPESNFHPAVPEDKNTWGKLTHTFVEGIRAVRGKRMLILALGIGLVLGLYSEGFDRLWDMHFIKDIGFPNIGKFSVVTWFGIINTITMIFSIIITGVVKRRLKNKAHGASIKLLFAINSLLVFSIILFGIAGNFTIAFAAYLASVVFRRVNGPLYGAWINKAIDSKVRATVLSMKGQMDSFGQIIGGPVIGFIASRFSISYGIVFAGLVLSPVIVLYILAIINNKKNAA